MKKMKIKVIERGEVVHFTNNGQVNGAPLGATIAAKVKAAKTIVNVSGTVVTVLAVDVRNPTTGQVFTVTVNDALVLNTPTMMELEVPMLFEIGNFENNKGVLIEGYPEKVKIADAYNPYAIIKLDVIDQNGQRHEDSVVATGVATVWGLV